MTTRHKWYDHKKCNNQPILVIFALKDESKVNLL